jgi:cytochrome c-type biogenesis protein CcmH
MAEIEAELMCPTCQSRLDLSHSPAADRIRAYVERRRDEGWTKQQVKDALVADFGPSVLAAPPAAGIGLVAWVVPGALVAGGVVVVIALTLVWRRRRAPTTAAEHELDPALDERVDEALRAFGDDE